MLKIFFKGQKSSEEVNQKDFTLVGPWEAQNKGDSEHDLERRVKVLKTKIKCGKHVRRKNTITSNDIGEGNCNLKRENSHQ